MKLSELGAYMAPPQSQSDVAEMPPCSQFADPPILLEEINAARGLGDQETVCRWHKGLIATSPTAMDTEGRVFYCPVGRMWWRYTKKISGMHSPLSYRWRS